MQFYTEGQLRALASSRTSILAKRADFVLNQSLPSPAQDFDVFLSHSIKDAELILGIKLALEAAGVSVYVYWMNDESSMGERVSAATAERLRKRMKKSKALVYAHSPNTASSKWMPWELGYFDGLKGKIAVMPILRSQFDSFEGQEFVSFYPVIDFAGAGAFVIETQNSSLRKSLSAWARS